MDKTQRYAICVEYCGVNYNGWQIQLNGKTIQQELATAIGKVSGYVADEKIVVIAAGRTDSGVHATGQIAHFDSSAQRLEFQWLRGINTYLPEDIVISWVKPVAVDFHARYKAKTRTYRYVIQNRHVRPSYLHGRVTWVSANLDIVAMQGGAQYLLGTHDFTAFRAAGCQNKNPVKRIDYLHVSRAGEWVWIDIKASGFLHHMVRNIAGVLLDVGSGRAQPDWVKTILDSADRTCGGITAPASGLYFTAVEYDSEYNLPATPAACRFW